MVASLDAAGYHPQHEPYGSIVLYVREIEEVDAAARVFRLTGEGLEHPGWGDDPLLGPYLGPTVAQHWLGGIRVMSKTWAYYAAGNRQNPRLVRQSRSPEPDDGTVPTGSVAPLYRRDWQHERSDRPPSDLEEDALGFDPDPEDVERSRDQQKEAWYWRDCWHAPKDDPDLTWDDQEYPE